MVFSLKKAMKTTIYGLLRTFGSTEFERKKRRKNVRFLRFGALRCVPTDHFTHILPALIALPTEAMLRKALIRAAKTPQAAGTFMRHFFQQKCAASLRRIRKYDIT
jgi:hypothetical protein